MPGRLAFSARKYTKFCFVDLRPIILQFPLTVYGTQWIDFITETR